MTTKRKTIRQNQSYESNAESLCFESFVSTPRFNHRRRLERFANGLIPYERFSKLFMMCFFDFYVQNCECVVETESVKIREKTNACLFTEAEVKLSLLNVGSVGFVEGPNFLLKK